MLGVRWRLMIHCFSVVSSLMTGLLYNWLELYYLSACFEFLKNVHFLPLQFALGHEREGIL